MSYEFPLNPDAVAAADDRFYAMNPGPPMHDENGNRIPLNAQNTDEHDLHELWHDLYHEELAKREGQESPDEGDEDDDGDDGSGEYPEAPEDEEEFRDIRPGGGSCPKDEISLYLSHHELFLVNDPIKIACTSIMYRALLTDSTQKATSGTWENRWSDIPPGNCEFSKFDYLEPGTAAVLPDFKL